MDRKKVVEYKMEKGDLLIAIKRETSFYEFFKLKESIMEALGKSALSKKVSGIKSYVDLFSLRGKILEELENGKDKNIKKKDLKTGGK